MSIQRSGDAPRIPGIPSGKRQAQRSDRSPEPAAAEDVVELTPSARNLSQLAEAVSEADEVRTSRVEVLRERIRLGRYNPDSREVARRFLDFERRL